MNGWYAEGTPGRSARGVIALTVLAVVLVAAVPLALLAGVILMLLGHVVGGFALFGASVLAAVLGVAVAGLTGVRHVRKLLTRSGFRIVPLDVSQYTDMPDQQDSDHDGVLRLERSEYSDVR